MLFTAFAMRRVARSIRGPVTTQGVLFVWSGFATFGGMTTIAVRFGDRLPNSGSQLLWGSLAVFTAAALLMIGAAIWHDVIQFGLGLVVMTVNIAGVLAGPGWHSLVVAVFGGGALIGVALLYRRPARRRW